MIQFNCYDVLVEELSKNILRFIDIILTYDCLVTIKLRRLFVHFYLEDTSDCSFAYRLYFIYNNWIFEKAAVLIICLFTQFIQINEFIHFCFKLLLPLFIFQLSLLLHFLHIFRILIFSFVLI